jgi:hypothetical protein
MAAPALVDRSSAPPRPLPPLPVVDGGRASSPVRAQVRDATVQLALAAAFYQLYSAARHWVAGSAAVAQQHAVRIIGIERALGIFGEASIQAAALSQPGLVRVAGIYYGSVHFAVPIVALVALFHRDRKRFVLYRNAFAWMSALAVVAFALWPVMPPRLLPSSFGFVAPATAGIDRPLVPALYNDFAAMPSLHIAYSSWALLALWPVLRSRFVRGLLVADLVTTLAVVVVTGNHFFLDAVGGVVVALVGVGLARRAGARRWNANEAALALGGLLAAVVFVWLPDAARPQVVGDLLLAGGLGAALLWARGARPVPACA